MGKIYKQNKFWNVREKKNLEIKKKIVHSPSLFIFSFIINRRSNKNRILCRQFSIFEKEHFHNMTHREDTLYYFIFHQTWVKEERRKRKEKILKINKLFEAKLRRRVKFRLFHLCGSLAHLSVCIVWKYL